MFARLLQDNITLPASKVDQPEIWLLVDSSRIGGIETHIATLARALSRQYLSVEVVFLADYGPHPLQPVLDQASLRYSTLAGGFSGLFRAIWQRRPALLHTHGYKAGMLGRFAGRLLRVPVVSTYHSGEPGSPRIRFYKALDLATARLARCIAVSDAICDRLPKGATLIDNFVELPEEAEVCTVERPATVAFVGRLSPEKGPDVFCLLASDFPGVAFEVYGDGPLRSALEARYGARVRFRGTVPSMSNHWPQIGLLCMPSHYEGMPMAALEALAHGVPVCAFAVGNLPRCIEHGRNGWLADAGDRAQLAAGLAAWLAQGEQQRAETSRAARAMIEHRFSAGAGAARVIAVYADALKVPALLPRASAEMPGA